MDLLIDSHTHLETFQRKGELGEILGRAKDAGVGRLISVGTGPWDWELYRGLAERHRGLIYYTAGFHPSGIPSEWREGIPLLEVLFGGEGPVPVALGETGLDRFHLDRDPAVAEVEWERQKESFRVHLSLARRLDVPVVVHSRGAFWECVELVDESGVSWDRVVFHCFTEGASAMRALNERGGRGSFTGILTYKNASEVREAALEQGLGSFMLETDAPYLAPVPHRGKANEPAYLRATAEAAAELFGVSFEELVRRSVEETERFYGLGR